MNPSSKATRNEISFCGWRLAVFGFRFRSSLQKRFPLLAPLPQKWLLLHYRSPSLKSGSYSIIGPLLQNMTPTTILAAGLLGWKSRTREVCQQTAVLTTYTCIYFWRSLFWSVSWRCYFGEAVFRGAFLAPRWWLEHLSGWNNRVKSLLKEPFFGFGQTEAPSPSSPPAPLFL